MGFDDGNLQVIDGCRSDAGNLSNSYILYGTYLPVAVMVLAIHTISYICDIMSFGEGRGRVARSLTSQGRAEPLCARIEIIADREVSEGKADL